MTAQLLPSAGRERPKERLQWSAGVRGALCPAAVGKSLPHTHACPARLLDGIQTDHLVQASLHLAQAAPPQRHQPPLLLGAAAAATRTLASPRLELAGIGGAPGRAPSAASPAKIFRGCAAIMLFPCLPSGVAPARDAEREAIYGCGVGFMQQRAGGGCQRGISAASAARNERFNQGFLHVVHP